MIARIWSTGILKGKENEYLNFVKKESVPMFKMQTGILNVQILLQQEKSLVITYWLRVEDIELMENDELYKQTTQKILAGGFLTDTQAVEKFECQNLSGF